MIGRGLLRLCVTACLLCLPGLAPHAVAQGYGSTLRMQGVNHTLIPSAASRASGGISVGMPGEASLMFANPASLQSLEGLQISLGGINLERKLDQSQQWYPNRRFPTFSLMMEGLIDLIDDPDLSEVPEGGFGPEDSIARPYDDIQPDWSRKQPGSLSIQGFVALPVEVFGLQLVAGLGAIRYANLDYYFQNNNVLSPSIGTQRPVGIPLPAIGQEETVDWSQYIQQREGSIQGYGGALSIGIFQELSLGLSGLLLDGHSDELETLLSRGHIRFGNNSGVYYQLLDSVYSRSTRLGSSDYSGAEFSVSAMYRGPHLSLSLMVKPPSSISRTFQGSVQEDTTGTPVVSTVSGTDELLLPWRGAVGISLTVREDLMLGFEYEIRPLASAEYTDPSGEISQPWLSSNVFRIGGRFLITKWLAVAAGYREEAEVFQPEGNALIGEAVRYAVYSVGLGISFANVRLNAAYEYSDMTYEDKWATNVNLNRGQTHTLSADISYLFR